MKARGTVPIGLSRLGATWAFLVGTVMGVSRKERRGRKGSRKGPSVNTTAVSFKVLIFLSLGFRLEPPNAVRSI